ncbi:hypothetical protein [Algisphaera agarilytica]|uniref:Uncharacterized protein n=1 Tax=Algisphaera agarilytica TaxID=1385975 RepID=A0A7X0H7P7_9BACT|nr:hypothetical protein [Algisphaera agarilytica]MBB6430827.1 hypothetical protein [Algisphaera agarilytica]
MNESTPDFKGRVVCVTLADKAISEGTYILDPYFEIQAGRVFLVGNLTSNWKNLAGNTIAIAWDRVDSYIVADSIEEFQKAFSSNDQNDRGAEE